VQLAASGIGTLVAIPLSPGPEATSVYVACAVALSVLAVLAFAPMSYSTLARLYSLVFAALSVALAVLAGPVAPTFLVMCGALVLPLVLLPLREAGAFAIGTFALVSFVGWAHVARLIELEIPEIPTDLHVPEPWLGGLITILTISGPFAVLAGLLLRRYREAHSRSDRLVRELRVEVEERQAALEALQRAEQRLTHTQKLELLGQLAGGLAHDMNNALTAIMGEASFLKDSQAESREVIMEYARHAAQLTRQLLTLGRKEVVRPRPLDFTAEVRRSVASARRLFPSEIRVVEQYTSQALTVQADPSQITQIVLNLVVNSSDAMVGGGELRVSVEPSPASSNHVDLVIADTGHGIATADLDRIFEPFFSSKPAGVGTGLGLANVKDLVEGLEGSVAVHSELGVGTTFRVSLPLVDASPPEVAPLSAADAAAQGGGSILLVDDSQAIRRIAKSMLERAGHAVIAVGSGSEAIAWLSEGGRVDLVITDVVMPDGSGSTVIDWLKRERPQVPVLVMSGYTEDEQVKRGMRTGELPFLRKPFSAEDLVQAAQEVLRTAATRR
jgi:signal transduction histidine kinase/CheY-like chemotaxis protein